MSVQWRWDSGRTLWQRWCPEVEQWVSEHRSLPQWFIDAGGVVSSRRFIELWVQSSSWNELHQALFWWSADELQAKMDDLTDKLLKMGIQPPPMLSVSTSSNESDIESLMEEGVLSSLDGQPVNSEGGYDPMQAIFQAQSKRQEQLSGSRPQFQTLEQGKFTARH